MNRIELELGRNMQSELMNAQESADEKLQEAIELVLQKVVYPMIDRNIE